MKATLALVSVPMIYSLKLGREASPLGFSDGFNFNEAVLTSRPARMGMTNSVALAAYREYVDEALLTRTLPDLNLFLQQRRENSVYRVERNRSKPWADVEYPRALLNLRFDKWTAPKPNSSGLYVKLSPGNNTIVQTKEGYSVNGKRVEAHQWVGHELDCYRLYLSSTPMARQSGRPKR